MQIDMGQLSLPVYGVFTIDDNLLPKGSVQLDLWKCLGQSRESLGRVLIDSSSLSLRVGIYCGWVCVPVCVCVCLGGECRD